MCLELRTVGNTRAINPAQAPSLSRVPIVCCRMLPIRVFFFFFRLRTDTPNYSLVAEVPYRISDVYGQGPLRERGLKFLVLLREPAARTISSWEYKTDRESWLWFCLLGWAGGGVFIVCC